jgi:hypothetical protein
MTKVMTNDGPYNCRIEATSCRKRWLAIHWRNCSAITFRSEKKSKKQKQKQKKLR